MDSHVACITLIRNLTSWKTNWNMKTNPTPQQLGHPSHQYLPYDALKLEGHAFALITEQALVQLQFSNQHWESGCTCVFHHFFLLPGEAFLLLPRLSYSYLCHPFQASSYFFSRFMSSIADIRHLLDIWKYLKLLHQCGVRRSQGPFDYQVRNLFNKLGIGLLIHKYLLYFLVEKVGQSLNCDFGSLTRQE